MPEKVSHNKKLGIIEVRSYGVVSPEEIVSSVNLVEQIRTETGINKVLVDTLELKSFPSTMRIFDIVAQFPRSVRIAVVTSDEQPTKDDVRFTVTAASNRGVSIREFTSQADALEWLKK